MNHQHPLVSAFHSLILTPESRRFEMTIPVPRDVRLDQQVEAAKCALVESAHVGSLTPKVRGEVYPSDEGRPVPVVVIELEYPATLSETAVLLMLCGAVTSCAGRLSFNAVHMPEIENLSLRAR